MKSLWNRVGKQTPLFAVLMALALPLAAQDAAKPSGDVSQKSDTQKPEEPKPATAKDDASKDAASKTEAPAADPQKPDAAPADAKKAEAKDQAAAAESPVPSTENWLTGSIDLGYRWVTTGGSFDTHRSIINLGSGPKLLGTEFTITDPKRRLFDKIHVRAYSWGDEPYETLHLDASKSKYYNFNADYRDFAYFNYLPSYADPLASRGIVLNEQSFDQRRRLASFSLDLMPQSRFIPYLAFDRDSNSGHGASTYVSDGNEYPVPNLLRDSTNLYRGGIRIEMRRFHVTLEEGGTTFKDDQSLYQSNGTNFGNNSNKVFGQTLDLTNLLAAYGIRGTSTYSKALFTANPVSWADFYGQFLYSEPSTNVNYQQTAAGNLYLQSQVLFYSGQQYLLTSAAKPPHTTASAGTEIRPFKRVRIVESWMTDRLHNSGNAVSNQILSGPALTGNSLAMTALLASTLATNYSQNEVDVYFDPFSRLTLRGGYRYVWGDANQVILPAAGLASSAAGTLKRNVGLGGITYRPSQKLRLSAETEVAVGDGVYFRTSLYDYQKVRAQARYQFTNTLTVTADFSSLQNQNPLDPISGASYSFSSIQESASLFWNPGASKVFDFQGSYSHYDISADVGYFAPQDLSSQIEHYRERAHGVTALFDLNSPKGGSFAPKFSAGGSLYTSGGSRPTSYFQPLARLSVPFGKNVSWFSEWRYYGYGEAFYLYEGFRAHLFTTGLRFAR
jgi:hypothetical protein